MQITFINSYGSDVKSEAEYKKVNSFIDKNVCAETACSSQKAKSVIPRENAFMHIINFISQWPLLP